MSSDAGRVVFDFFHWLKSRSDFEMTDEVFSYFVVFFGKRRDFKAIHDLLIEGKGVVGEKSFESAIERLCKAGREKKAVLFFERMETDYGFVRSLDSLKVVVTKLCDYGYASYAEKMVKGLADKFFPDEYICDMLIKGWCVSNKLDEAVRFAGEMYRGGYEVSTFGCNQMLDCVCRLCRKKDPFRLKSEVEKMLREMEKRGIPRDVETFNVLISNLCKLRMTEDAMSFFRRMGEWGCQPNETTYILLVRSLYQAARLGEGDEMIDRMKSAGYGSVLDKKVYYGLLKKLCVIERIDHAMSVFKRMKADGCKPDILIYDLLMSKLVAHGRPDRANSLLKEAEKSGVLVEPKEYKVDPRFAKKKPIKKEKKRETLPEKKARRRRRLKKIRLSYVKKPKRMPHRRY